MESFKSGFVAVVGRPNVGKSSLLNALAGREAAIVTEIAGTTRDVLREHIHIDGMPLHVVDTAGLRDTDDQVDLERTDRSAGRCGSGCPPQLTQPTRTHWSRSRKPCTASRIWSSARGVALP